MLQIQTHTLYIEFELQRMKKRKTWLGSLNPLVIGVNWELRVLRITSALFPMMGRAAWTSPGWDGCNGGQPTDISGENPRVDEGPARDCIICISTKKYSDGLDETCVDMSDS